MAGQCVYSGTGTCPAKGKGAVFCAKQECPHGCLPRPVCKECKGYQCPNGCHGGPL